MRLGASFESVVQTQTTSAARESLVSPKTLEGLRRNKFLAVQTTTTPGRRAAMVVYSAAAGPLDILRGYWDALNLVDAGCDAKAFDAFVAALKEASWHLDRVQLRVEDWRVEE